MYVGKAVNLKARLNSYNLGVRHLNTKINELLKEATKLEWQILSSETEALIKESELIKKYQPKYNVLMRDDKQYFFVGFSKEEYPRIFLTHQTPKGPEYIGPFTDGGAIKSVLKMLRRAFPYCTCKRPHKGLCLNARIGRCLEFCCTQNAVGHMPYAVSYKNNISAIKKILTGKNKSLVKSLRVEMKKLSQEQKYEGAGKIRDQIKALEKIFAHKELISRDIISENIKAVTALEDLLKIKSASRRIKRIEAYDIANIQGKYAYGSMAVFIDGAPAKDLYRIFKIKTVRGSNDVAMLKEVISRRLKHKEWPIPEVILVDGGKPQLNAVSNLSPQPPLLTKERGRGGEVKIVSLTKNKQHKGDHIYIFGRTNPLPLDPIPSPLKNLLLNLDSEAHRFAIKHYRKSHRKTLS